MYKIIIGSLLSAIVGLLICITAILICDYKIDIKFDIKKDTGLLVNNETSSSNENTRDTLKNYLILWDGTKIIDYYPTDITFEEFQKLSISKYKLGNFKISWVSKEDKQ
jgi:hypothetical protein